MRTLQCTVPAAFDGRPLKHLLRGELGISSTLLKTLKWREGAILLNGAGVHVNAVVRTGDTVTVVLSERAPRETDVAPLDIPLAIVYEDEDLLVLNKPAGLAMHPMSTDLAAPNLAGALVAYLGEGTVFAPQLLRMQRAAQQLVNVAGLRRDEQARGALV